MDQSLLTICIYLSLFLLSCFNFLNIIQVPQFILDHMWGKGEVCKIVCTQPRRISAISGEQHFWISDLIFNLYFQVSIEICFLLLFLCIVSERISTERGETIGENVGYKVILLMYLWCSNGTVILYLDLFCMEIFMWMLTSVIYHNQTSFWHLCITLRMHLVLSVLSRKIYRMSSVGKYEFSFYCLNQQISFLFSNISVFLT